jgi:hypothetical protein
MKKMAWLSLLVLVVAVAGYFGLVTSWSYSSGDRAGWIQKFSRKGWICKTWEGELAMVSMPGTTPEKFAFTVRDETVAARINDAVGQRVRLHYEQHRGVPGDCFGETEYWVDGVTAFPEFGGGAPNQTNPQSNPQLNSQQNPPPMAPPGTLQGPPPAMPGNPPPGPPGVPAHGPPPGASTGNPPPGPPPSPSTGPSY